MPKSFKATFAKYHHIFLVESTDIPEVCSIGIMKEARLNSNLIWIDKCSNVLDIDTATSVKATCIAASITIVSNFSDVIIHSFDNCLSTSKVAYLISNKFNVLHELDVFLLSLEHVSMILSLPLMIRTLHL